MLTRLLLRSSFVALLATASLAQTAELSWSGGIMAGPMTYELSGAPGEAYAIVPARTLASTPLPGGALDIGLDLLHLLRVGLLSPTGATTEAFDLPADPALSGLPIHAQFVTFPGAGVLVDDVSNRVTCVVSFLGEFQPTFGDAPTPLHGSTATTLLDGRVLLAGGDDGGAAIDALWFYQPHTQEFELSSSTLSVARSGHTATRLDDGRVLFVGGRDGLGQTHASCELFDPASDLLVPAANMILPRVDHTATRSTTGRVVIAGGRFAHDGSADGGLLGVTSRVLTWIPASDTWAFGPHLNPSGGVASFGLIDHAATALDDGRVLVAGGAHVNGGGSPLVAVPTPDCWLFDPLTSQVAFGPDMASAHRNHAQLTLGDGSVLVGGGTPNGTSVERYDPVANAWTSVASTSRSRSGHRLFETASGVEALCGDDPLLSAAVTFERSVAPFTTWVPSFALSTTSAEPERLVTAEIDGGARVLLQGESTSADPRAAVLVR